MPRRRNSRRPKLWTATFRSWPAVLRAWFLAGAMFGLFPGNPKGFSASAEPAAAPPSPSPNPTPAPTPAPESSPAPAASAAPTPPPAPTPAPSPTPAPAAADVPIIPGFGPGESLPRGPLNLDDRVQMELIPGGMTPLSPQLSIPSQGFGDSQPLVQQPASPVDLKTLKYKVSQFTIKYGLPKQAANKRLPSAQALSNTTVTLSEAGTVSPGAAPVASPAKGAKPAKGAAPTPAPALERYSGLAGPGAGLRDIPVNLSQVKSAETFSGDALQAIYTAVVAQLNKRGIYGVFVLVDPDQINPSTGEDLRKGSTELTLLVYASEVRKVRTIVKPVAKWPFKAPSTGLDDPSYNKITAHSPLQPPLKDQPGTLLLKSSLQDYLDRINRFPGRRVDVAITASGEDAGVILDYIVHVERPGVSLFEQTSNTGTEASGTWRTRAGFEIRQLAHQDDILDASYETSLSSETYSAFGSYQITPIFPDYLKVRAYGGYGRFDAEDVGFDQEQFVGRSGTAGLLFILTPLYVKGFPVDLIGGVEYKNVDILNDGAFPQEGRTGFLLPIGGISTDKSTELYSLSGSLQFQPNIPGLIGTDNDQLQKMGRFDVNKSFLIAKYSLGGSVFLEPILFRKKWQAYEDETDPAKRKGYWPLLTEAHEFAFSVRGQYTFDDKRLVPQFEDVIGGFTSVRGYPEAYTAGDDTFVGNVEYRLHVTRLFKPADTNPPADPTKVPPAPRFSLRPPTILGRPDLDVIVRLFYDYGYAKNNDLLASTEADRRLMSTGVGAEVQVSHYLNLRLDWGFPLVDVTDKTSRPVSVGSSRISFVAVLSY